MHEWKKGAESPEELFELAYAAVEGTREMVVSLRRTKQHDSPEGDSGFAEFLVAFWRIRRAMYFTSHFLPEQCGIVGGEAARVSVCGEQGPSILSAVLRWTKNLHEAFFCALREPPSFEALAAHLDVDDAELTRRTVESCDPRALANRLSPLLASLSDLDLRDAITDLRAEWDCFAKRRWTLHPLRAWKQGHQEALRWLALARRFREVWERYVTPLRFEFFRATLPPLLRSSWAYGKWLQTLPHDLLADAEAALHRSIGEAVGELRHEIYADDEDLDYLFPDIAPDIPWFTLPELIQNMDDDELEGDAGWVADVVARVCLGNDAFPLLDWEDFEQQQLAGRKC